MIDHELEQVLRVRPPSYLDRDDDLVRALLMDDGHCVCPGEAYAVLHAWALFLWRDSSGEESERWALEYEAIAEAAAVWASALRSRYESATEAAGMPGRTAGRVDPHDGPGS